MTGAREKTNRFNEILDEVDDRVYAYYGIANPRTSLVEYSPNGDLDCDAITKDLRDLRARRPYDQGTED